MKGIGLLKRSASNLRFGFMAGCFKGFCVARAVNHVIRAIATDVIPTKYRCDTACGLGALTYRFGNRFSRVP